MKLDLRINGAKRSVEFDTARREVTIDGRKMVADAAEISSGAYSILLDGQSFEVSVEASGGGLLVRAGDREFQMQIFDPRSWRRGRSGSIELEGRQEIVAPMPGKIVRVLATPGEKVEAGQGLLVIEAMKMQNEIRSPKSGTLERLAREGNTVRAGEILAVVT
ncbi:MAG: acetyl-CoA carboxylase biotin carboxyl carrier protein subunit [Acidobacteriia bacterium]|nr:acetyl-CoA carboxylase biotin carboxyl carrier protein subunit [Terriglobia bacterium]